jgi:anti-sigma28 factor (negative regulator of flagellin synthesis)
MPASPKTPKLIDYSKFLRALQLAIAPAPNDRRDLPAIDGKRSYACFPGLSKNSPLTKLGTTPIPLTDEDAKCLRTLMKKYQKELPPLRAEPRLQDAENFLNAYRKLKDRPQWEPVIRSEEDSRMLRERRLEVRAEHVKRLQKAITEGQVQLFDANRVSQAADDFQARSYVPVEHAVEYVKSIAMDPKMVLAGLIPADGAEKTSTREGKQAHPDHIKKIAVELLNIPDHAAGARLLGGTVRAFLVNAKRWQREQDATARQDTSPELRPSTWPSSDRTIFRDGKKPYEPSAVHKVPRAS